MNKRCFILSIILANWFFVNSANSLVEAPNYNFSLDMLKPFYPDGDIKAVEKDFGIGEIIKENGQQKLTKYYLRHIRYNFPIYLQTDNGKSTGFYATLPSYFSHDLFHQALINRFGKQDHYFKKENHAVYVWNNKENNKIIYNGGCTIICFPVYLTIFKNDKAGATPPLIEEIMTGSRTK